MRSSSVGPLIRAGVAGIAAAGIAALVVEDSGFLTAGIYSLYPAIGFAVGYVELYGSGRAPALDEPPRDAGDQHDGDDDRRDRE